MRPPRSQQTYHKEGSPDIAGWSAMDGWYDADSGTAFMSVDFRD
ncbi:hypothetical protein [Luteolibacter soli]|uniref:Uncharacterized protein n=1 Tax=Luteolibacter soli TaxID=3135280 RepID=A0ABU9AQL4_9BACT